jgi:hypothetical protein
MNTKSIDTSAANQSSPFHQAVEAYLKESGYDFSVDQFKSRALYQYAVSTESGEEPVTVEIFIKPYSDQFSLFAYASKKISESRRLEVLEMLTSPTFKRDGFREELELSTGAVRCGFASCLMEECVTPKRLRQMEQRSTLMMSTIMPMLENYCDDASPL